MKEITDKMAKKALSNVKWVRRLKPLWVVTGLVMWGFAGIWARFLYRYVQDPWPYESTADTAFTVSWMTVKVVFLLLMGTWMVCMGLIRSPKDMLLEYLAEENLKNKQIWDSEQSNK
jgi:hypothetical protein